MSGFNIASVLGLGTDGIDKGVLGMPFVQIVQKGSPEIDETHKDHTAKKIEGCRPGSIIFAPERKILPGPVSIIPLAVISHYTEWKPRAQGGGLVGIQPLSIVSSPQYRKGAANTPDSNKEWLGSNELKFTILAAVRFLMGTEWKRGLVSFSATGLKPARIWSKQILNLRYSGMPDAVPPIFAAIWKFSSTMESNDKGGWYGWKIELDRMLDPVADQVLLESTFTEYNSEQAKLPRSAPVAQITDKVEGDEF